MLRLLKIIIMVLLFLLNCKKTFLSSLKKLIENKKIRDIMGQRSRLIINKKFTSERCLYKYKDFYLKLLK